MAEALFDANPPNVPWIGFCMLSGIGMETTGVLSVMRIWPHGVQKDESLPCIIGGVDKNAVCDTAIAEA